MLQRVVGDWKEKEKIEVGEVGTEEGKFKFLVAIRVHPELLLSAASWTQDR